MLLDLKGKRAIVCGSTQGIGKAAAIELAALGAEIVLIARSKEKLEQVVRELDATSGQKHSYLVVDFSDAEKLKSSLHELLKKTYPIHILINNTGGPPGGPVFDAEVEAFQQAFNNHLICNHILVQALVPGMKEVKYGRIINVISTSVKQPLPNLGVSNTIRGAVANWAKTLANELGPFGICVNNILPGATNTQRLNSIIENKSSKTKKEIKDIEAEMLHEIPAGRFAQPEELAYAIAFLASPSAAYINGINLPVDGGRTSSL